MEAGRLKDGRWDVVKMRWWAALKRETYSKERCHRIAAILGEIGLNVLSFIYKPQNICYSRTFLLTAVLTNDIFLVKQRRLCMQEEYTGKAC